MKPATIRQLRSMDDTLRTVAFASGRKDDWKSMIARWLREERAMIKVGIESANDLEIELRRARTLALDQIARMYEIENWAEETDSKLDTYSTYEQKVTHLNRTMTPSGWYEQWGYKLNDIAEAAAENLLNGERPLANKALRLESISLLRFLRSVEQHGISQGKKIAQAALAVRQGKVPRMRRGRDGRSG